VRTVPVIVDSCLRVDGNLIGQDLAEEIFDELTIYNTAKDVAKRMNRWGWEDLPDDFQLGLLDGDTVVMPRGYAYQLKTLLRENDLRVQWVDRRRWRRGESLNGDGKLSLRPHQRRAARQIIRHQQGMYEAPTGSGKTVTCIGFLAQKNPRKTLILVDQLGLLNQWRAEIALWLGLNIDDIGQIGQGKWQEGARITVATVQSIWRKKPEEKWFEGWDCVIVDECHHVPAVTIQEIVGNFTAKYRFGVSATPDRKNDKFEFALNILGEVFWQDDEEALREARVLMEPVVQVIRTDFEFYYWPDHDSDEDHECLVPLCKFNGKRPHSHRNNYANLKSALVEDPDRNMLVTETVWYNVQGGDHHHLIVSDEIRQLDALYTVLLSNHSHAGGLPPVFVMTGKVKGQKREEIKREISRAPAAIVFATVAKEGLDIPKVDRIYMPFPVSNAKKTQQWIGRGTRMAEGKRDTWIFDFFDVNIPILKKQFRSRRFGCYDKLGIEVRLG
jgi:superfamily II DNA or RNA helicase